MEISRFLVNRKHLAETRLDIVPYQARAVWLRVRCYCRSTALPLLPTILPMQR